MIIIDELELARILKYKIPENEYYETMDYIHDKYSIAPDSIPIEWIREYASKHDAVCVVNLENMIKSWEISK